MLDFKPPFDNEGFVAFCKWALPLELGVRADAKVEVADDGVERFRALRGKQVAVIVNHSDQDDPEMLFAFSKILKENFYFIAAREVFDWLIGLTGLCLQSVGCYSVVRGEADLESFKMTRSILAMGKRKLVVFPEGEVSRDPDTLLPLRKGVARLFLEGQRELLKMKPGEALLVQPIGIRWHFENDITPKLEHQLRKIERRLNIRSIQGNLEKRIRLAGMEMMRILEVEYCISHPETVSYESRIALFRKELLQRLANMLGVHLPPEDSHLDWLRKIANHARLFIAAETSSNSAFQWSCHKEEMRKMRKVLRDVRRLQKFVGVKEPAEGHIMTQERLSIMLSKIEREVLGYISHKGTRIATLAVGEPFSVLDYYALFESDKVAAQDKLTDVMAEKLKQLVLSLDRTRARGKLVGAI